MEMNALNVAGVNQVMIVIEIRVHPNLVELYLEELNILILH